MCQHALIITPENLIKPEITSLGSNLSSNYPVYATGFSSVSLHYHSDT